MANDAELLAASRAGALAERGQLLHILPRLLQTNPLSVMHPRGGRIGASTNGLRAIKVRIASSPAPFVLELKHSGLPPDLRVGNRLAGQPLRHSMVSSAGGYLDRAANATWLCCAWQHPCPRQAAIRRGTRGLLCGKARGLQQLHPNPKAAREARSLLRCTSSGPDPTACVH